MSAFFQQVNHFVRRRRFESVGGLLGLVIVTAGIVVVADLGRTNREVEKLYNESVAGLNQVSDLQYRVQETRRLALYSLTSTDGNVQLQSVDATRAMEKQATDRITAHRQMLADMGRLENWNRLQTDWLAYLKVRDEVLASALEDSRQVAIALDLKDGTPLFERVRDDLNVIKQFHLNLAITRLSEVQGLSHRSIFKVVTILVLCLIGAVVAVYVLRRSTLAVRESEARFRGVIESLGEGILITDVDDTILFLNPRTSEMLGWNSEEILGRKAGEMLMSPENAALVSTRNARCFQGISEEYETVLRHKDGRQICVAVHGTPFRDAAGGITGALAALTDLTEKKLAEQHLEQQKKLVETSRLVGMAEVATGVLHNVGNVLNSVSVSATLVGDRLRQSKLTNLCRATAMLRAQNGHLVEFLTSDPKGKLLPEYLGTMADQLAREQTELITEMGSVAQYIEHIKEIVAMQQDYAKVSGAYEIVSAAGLVEDALRMNTAAFEHHQIQIVREFDEATPAVCVDRHKVLQILINLIRNAKHAMDEQKDHHKRLVIRVELASPEWVRILVRDNGAGISPENSKRVFQHGFTTKKDGHGFGLHSGANAAKEMGGRLTAHSDGLGQGATFTLDLPVTTSAQREKTTPNKGSHEHR